MRNRSHQMRCRMHDKAGRCSGVGINRLCCWPVLSKNAWFFCVRPPLLSSILFLAWEIKFLSVYHPSNELTWDNQNVLLCYTLARTHVEEKETVLVEKQQNFGKAVIGFDQPIAMQFSNQVMLRMASVDKRDDYSISWFKVHIMSNALRQMGKNAKLSFDS